MVSQGSDGYKDFKKMKIFFMVILMMSIPHKLFAETGFGFSGDLNGDGIDDQIQSGPSSLFGNAGGPCVLTVSVSVGESNKKIVNCNRAGMILEKSDYKFIPSRLWNYGRHSAGEGTVSAVVLDGSFKTEYLTLYIGGEDSIGSSILAALKKGVPIKFQQLDNYTPPQTPCGLEWGKGC